MRYNFYSNKVDDVCLALSIDIVKGKYKIGEYLPQKVKLAEEYDVSRPMFNVACDELEKANVIQNLGKEQGREQALLFVPHNTNAACYVAGSLAKKLKECSRMLELIGFGAREARNQLFLKQIVNTLPVKLRELEGMGKIQIHGEKHENALFETNVIDEDILIKTDEYRDIVNVLQEML